MKKILKIIAVFIIAIFLILLILPFAFQGKISQIAKEEINNNINAKVDFDKLSLSFIRSFPNVKISLINLSVVGIGTFQNDTLAFIGDFGVTVGIPDLMKQPIEIKSILIDRAQIHALVKDNGQANWDISMESVENQEEPAGEKSESAIGLRLKEFRISKAQIIYRDEAGHMSSQIDDLDFLLSGDLSADRSTLKTITNMGAFSFQMDGITYLNRAPISLNADIDADLTNSKYTFINNLLRVNALELGFDGWIAMPGEDMELDVTFDAKKSDFKQLLSLVPAIYRSNFQDMKASGEWALNGEIKGIYNDNRWPAFDCNIRVDKGRFQYPDLPSAVENIQIDLNINNVDGIEDHTLIDLKNFHLEMAQNPFDLQMKIATPISDPSIEGKMKGTIDLNKFKDMIPLEDMIIGGIIHSDIEIKGNLSSIENEEYNDFHALGYLELKDFKYVDIDDSNGIEISTAKAVLSPQLIHLKELKGKAGQSDFSLEGKLDHLLGWYFNEKDLKGVFDFTSQKMVLADFMGEEQEAETTVAPTTEESTVIEIPANIDFVIFSQIKQLTYDSLLLRDVKGKIALKDSKASMENMGMKLLDGSMEINGYYSSENMEKPVFSLDINAHELDVKKSFDAFNTIQKLAPIARFAQGNISAQMDISGLLKQNMDVDLASINSSGRLLSDHLSIKNTKILDQISALLNTEKFKQLKLDQLNLSYIMKDGKLDVKPFDTQFGNSKMTIAGSQSLDQSIDYGIAFTIPSSEFGSKANDVANSLLGEAGKYGIDLKVPENIKFKALIGGTLSDPKVSLDMKNQASNMADDLKKQAEQKIEEGVDKAKQKAIEEAQKQADQLMSEADKQGKKIIAEAQNLAAQVHKEVYKQADAAKEEAYKQADKLVNDAGSDMVKKMLAQTAAENLKKEADNAAHKVKAEADTQQQKKIQLAKNQAQKLKDAAKKEGDELIAKARK